MWGLGTKSWLRRLVLGSLFRTLGIYHLGSCCKHCSRLIGHFLVACRNSKTLESSSPKLAWFSILYLRRNESHRDTQREDGARSVQTGRCGSVNQREGTSGLEAGDLTKREVLSGAIGNMTGCLSVTVGGLCGARWNERGQSSLREEPSVPTRGGLAKGSLYCFQQQLALIYNSKP